MRRKARTDIPLFAIRHARKLNVPVPPSELLEDLCGYRGHQRYVALYLVPEEEAPLQLIIEAGTNNGPANPTAFLRYAHHPRIWPEISTVHCGFMGDTEQWLVLDRMCRQLYAATIQDAISLIVRLGPYPEYPNSIAEPDPIRMEQLSRWLQCCEANSEEEN